MYKNSKKVAALIFALVFVFTITFNVAFADQNSVNYVVKKISENVTAKKWKAVEANIQDLDKTLYNEIVTQKTTVDLSVNPIRDRQKEVQERLNQISQEYKVFYNSYLQYIKASKNASKQALSDITGELVSKLSLISGGKLSPLTASSNKNDKFIAEDMKTIKTLSAMGKYLKLRMDSLKPAIREAEKERTELVKLNEKYIAVINKYVNIAKNGVPVPTGNQTNKPSIEGEHPAISGVWMEADGYCTGSKITFTQSNGVVTGAKDQVVGSGGETTSWTASNIKWSSADVLTYDYSFSSLPNGWYNGSHIIKFNPDLKTATISWHATNGSGGTVTLTKVSN